MDEYLRATCVFFWCLTMRLDCMSHLGNTNETGRMKRRCGCRVQRVENKCVLRRYKQFRCYTRQEVNTRDFGGVLYKDLVYAEECFDLRATVLTDAHNRPDLNCAQQSCSLTECVRLNAGAGAPVARNCLLTRTKATRGHQGCIQPWVQVGWGVEGVRVGMNCLGGCLDYNGFGLMVIG